MKKAIKTMMMMLVASAFVLTSCKDDESVEDVKLTINPSATSGTHFVGDTLKLVINGKGNSDNALKNLTITESPTGGSPKTLVNEKLSGTDKIYNFERVITQADVNGSPITFSIKLEGEKGTAATISYVATISVVTPINVVPAAGLRLGSQSNQTVIQHFAKIAGDFNVYDLDASEANFQNDIDMVYYYGTTNKHSITSPSNTVMQGLYSGIQHWGKARTTGFYRMPQGDAGLFDQVIADDDDRKLIPYAAGKTYTDALTDVAAGDVFLFKTQEGKLGLLKVLSVTGATNSSGILDFRALSQID